MKFQIEEAGWETFRLKEEVESMRIQTSNWEKEIMWAHEERLKEATERYTETINETWKSYEEKMDEKSKNSKRKLKEVESELTRGF